MNNILNSKSYIPVDGWVGKEIYVFTAEIHKGLMKFRGKIKPSQKSSSTVWTQVINIYFTHYPMQLIIRHTSHMQMTNICCLHPDSSKYM